MQNQFEFKVRNYNFKIRHFPDDLVSQESIKYWAMRIAKDCDTLGTNKEERSFFFDDLKAIMEFKNGKS